MADPHLSQWKCLCSTVKVLFLSPPPCLLCPPEHLDYFLPLLRLVSCSLLTSLDTFLPPPPLPHCSFLWSSLSLLVVLREQLALLQYRLSMSSMPCQPHAPPGSGTLHTYQVLLPFHSPPPLWGLLEVILIWVHTQGYFSQSQYCESPAQCSRAVLLFIHKLLHVLSAHDPLVHQLCCCRNMISLLKMQKYFILLQKDETQHWGINLPTEKCGDVCAHLPHAFLSHLSIVLSWSCYIERKFRESPHPANMLKEEKYEDYL